MLTADLNRSQPPHRLPTARRTRAAFTLIELMVVIGIIMLLVGISVYAYTQVTRHSKAQKTKAALEVCRALMAEYEATAGAAAARQLVTDTGNSWNNAGQPLDANPPRPYAFDVQTRLLLRELLRSPNSKKILARLPAESLQYAQVQINRQLTENLPLILDGYGKPIFYIPPAGLVNLTVGGQPPTPNRALRSDGQFHPLFPIASNLTGFWVSVGPDGKLYEGDDNQYSFEN